MSIQFKRGLKRNLPNGAVGEPLFTTDTNELYIGTGATSEPVLVNQKIYDKNTGNSFYVWIGTQTEYNALTTYADDTIYLIKAQ